MSDYFHLVNLTPTGEQVAKPIHTAMLDVHNECAYILRTEHFSKFAVGGVKPPPIEIAQ